MPQEIHPAQLVAEAVALVHRGAEIVFAEHIGFERVGRDHGGVARVAAQQRQLAEEIAGAEPRDLAARSARP